MNSWPISLQSKLNVDNFKKKYGNTRVVSDVDVGPAKVRSRFTKAVDGYDCQVWLDFSDIPTWETFYKTTLGNGTLPFLFIDPFTGVETAYRFSPAIDPSLDPIGGRTFVLNMSWEFIP